MKRWAWVMIISWVSWTLGCGVVDHDLNPQPDAGEVPQEVPQQDQDPFTEPQPKTVAGPQCDGPGPVKVALLVDTSGSMQFADPQSQRMTAVQSLIDRYQDQANVSFAIVRFYSRVRINGDSPDDDGFTRDPQILAEAVNGLAMADALSDVQGALIALGGLIEADMAQTPAGTLAGTRYVSVLITDGGPGVVCQAGCENDFLFGGEQYGAGECTGGMCGTPPRTTQVLSWCDLPRESWCDELNLDGDRCGEVEQWFEGLEAPCLAYNTSEALLAEVSQIMGLAAQYGAGQVQLHTVRLFDVSLSPEMQELMGIDMAENARLLEQLTQRGMGTFHDVSQGDLDLSVLDLSSVGCAP